VFAAAAGSGSGSGIGSGTGAGTVIVAIATDGGDGRQVVNREWHLVALRCMQTLCASAGDDWLSVLHTRVLIFSR
jgi:hypothetical protein